MASISRFQHTAQIDLYSVIDIFSLQIHPLLATVPRPKLFCVAQRRPPASHSQEASHSQDLLQL